MNSAFSEDMMLRIKTLLIVLIATGLTAPALVGCGSDDGDQTEQSNDAEDDDQFDLIDPDGLQVVVDVAPTRYVYDLDTAVAPSATVYEWDRELENIDVEWSISPDDAVESLGTSYNIVAAGRITFTACAIDESGETTDHCGERTIISSGDHSEVVIQSPAPGEHFDGSEDTTIPVQGTIHDDIAATSVQVNGEQAQLHDDGTFSHELPPRFGINPIEVRVFDGVHDEDYVANTTAMWAEQYRSNHSEDSVGGGFNDALLLSLGQLFFDDGEPYQVISESQIITRDLADMLELLLDSLDINAQIPDPVVDTDALQLSVPDVTLGEPVVEIFTTDEGIEIYGQVPGLVAETEGDLELSDESVDLDGDIQGTVSLFAALDIAKPSADDDFEVELSSFDLVLEEAQPNFADDSANAVFELAESMLRTELEDIILDSLDVSFIDNLPEIVIDMLQSLDDALAEQSFDLDLDFGPAMSVDFQGRVGQLTTTYGQGLQGNVDAQLAIDRLPIHPDNPGVPVYRPDDNQSPLLEGNRVQIGIDLTALNSVFHALWNTGFLDLNITDLVPGEVEGLIQEGHTEAVLPPLLVPPQRDEDYDLMLELGQLELDLDWMDQNDRFAVNVVMGADLQVIGDDISIQLSDDPQLKVWLIETDDDEPVMDGDDVRDLLETLILPELEDEIGDNLTFSLPLPELDVLEDYAPALVDMDLDVRLNRSPHIRGGYMMLDATLEGTYTID